MIEGRFPAMGTEVVVVARGRQTVDSVQSCFAEVESVCSRFLADSELTIVNETPDESVLVSALLAEVLHQADEMRARTNGLVDPVVGKQVEAWGYDRSFEMVTGLTEPPQPRPSGDWRIEDRELHREPGTRLDLGGIAKGWTCDRAVAGTDALVVNAGGDLRSIDPDLVVKVEDPWGDVIATVKLGQGALATSTVAHRAWQVGEEWVSHLIDPRTLRPTMSPIISATVTAGSAVEAEAAAKAVLLLGEEGLAWAARQSWVRGALVLWGDHRVFATTGLELAA